MLFCFLLNAQLLELHWEMYHIGGAWKVLVGWVGGWMDEWRVGG